MREVVVAGAGMTAFGKYPERSLRSLTEEAVKEALDDAGLEPGRVETVYFANAAAGLMTGQEMIRGQVALRDTGVLGVPVTNVENACASGSTAFHLAWLTVASGECEVALAVGAEKLTHPDKSRSFQAMAAAVDVDRLRELASALREDRGGETGGAGEKRSLFMDIYAKSARAYMERSGASQEDFARVAAKNHRHGALNPRAQYGREMSVEDVLESREIAWPLTLLMCSPISDGAAALVLCSAEFGARLGVDPVRVRATALVSGRDRKPGEPNATERAARTAYERAGVGPVDLDLVEVHDAAAPAELIAYENLGLCPRGEGPKLLADGQTEIGGRLPVNTSGGLESKGHPVGASGCAQLVELTEQIRGRAGPRQVSGARIGLAQNGGGFLSNDAAAMTVTILSR